MPAATVLDYGSLRVSPAMVRFTPPEKAKLRLQKEALHEASPPTSTTMAHTQRLATAFAVATFTAVSVTIAATAGATATITLTDVLTPAAVDRAQQWIRADHPTQSSRQFGVVPTTHASGTTEHPWKV